MKCASAKNGMPCWNGFLQLALQRQCDVHCVDLKHPSLERFLAASAATAMRRALRGSQAPLTSQSLVTSLR